jgi:adenylate cyclase class 2
MQQEIEAKFLHVDIAQVRAKLAAAGAHCEQPMRLMRRMHFDYPDQRFQKNNHARRLRVRDEGDKVTMTYKARNETNYTYEIETTVGSYDETVAILKAIDLEAFTDQESRRETWIYKNVEVVIDEWPWLEPYIEIEGPDENSIKAAAKDLGFEWKDARFGSVDTAYMDQYKGMKESDSVGDLAVVKFDLPVPKYFKDRIKV